VFYAQLKVISFLEILESKFKKLERKLPNCGRSVPEIRNSRKEVAWFSL
jgi:hypothetical protein